MFSLLHYTGEFSGNEKEDDDDEKVWLRLENVAQFQLMLGKIGVYVTMNQCTYKLLPFERAPGKDMSRWRRHAIRMSIDSACESRVPVTLAQVKSAALSD